MRKIQRILGLALVICYFALVPAGEMLHKAAHTLISTKDEDYCEPCSHEVDYAQLDDHHGGEACGIAKILSYIPAQRDFTLNTPKFQFSKNNNGILEIARAIDFVASKKFNLFYRCGPPSILA